MHTNIFFCQRYNNKFYCREYENYADIKFESNQLYKQTSYIIPICRYSPLFIKKQVLKYRLYNKIINQPIISFHHETIHNKN